MNHVTFVTPWFGPDIPGGMEAETRRTIAHLQAAGFNVEVLTTCIRDFHTDWGKNHHRPGVEVVDGVTVRRFPVLPRDKTAFDAVNWRLMKGLPITPEEEQIYIYEMFKCPALFDHIRQTCQDTIYFFIPYMFATTYFGAQICPQRTAVIPCLHDESYAYLSLYRSVLPQVHTLVLHVESERALADRLFGPAGSQVRAVIGEGVDTDWHGDAARFRARFGLEAPFVMYVGRRDAGKNVPLLVDYWQQYVQAAPTDMKLVLIGPGDVDLPPAAAGHVVDLGFVSRQEKYDAYAAAAVLCQPSINESFSLVVMESWLAETPVLVHGRCAVTREHCQKSNGGLYFSSYPEFAATLDYLREHPPAARQMGRNGRKYVLAHYQWPQIIEQYKQIIAAMQMEETPYAASHA
ncbi:MAG: glycosyltransferase family 4 protein [Ardenticatenaceae bacterium]|nr:glycosyltransferase family 4 protein [Ardenticatenaceae bacterium]